MHNEFTTIFNFFFIIILLSIKKAEAAKEEASKKQIKLQQTKNQHAKHKPSLVMNPAKNVLKNASAEETVDAILATKDEQESREDKMKANSITIKEKRMWLALLEHLQATVKYLSLIFFTNIINYKKNSS